jgi:hypothetical protein
MRPAPLDRRLEERHVHSVAALTPRQFGVDASMKREPAKFSSRVFVQQRQIISMFVFASRNNDPFMDEIILISNHFKNLFFYLAALFTCYVLF